MDQAHIYFSGSVQGVGFRYTTLNYAKDLDLKGWVKNLSNGKVEATVEGNSKEIEELCQRLKDHFGAYIHDVVITWKTTDPQFNDFQIHH